MEIFAPHDGRDSLEGAIEGAIELGEFYQTIFGHAEFAVYVLRVDEDGGCTFDDANEGVAGLAGRPTSEICGRTPAECLPAEIADCLVSNLRLCLESGRSLTYERTLELPDGRMSWKTSLMPVAPRFGRTRHVVGLTRDITHEAKLLDRARHDAALLQGLGLALPSAIYLLDLQAHTISFVGGDADERRQRWRKGAEEAGSLAVEHFFHPEDQEKAAAHWRELATLKDGEITTIDFRILSPEGEYRRHLNRETVFSRDEAGAVALVLGVSEDVSRQDRTQQKVRDLAERMLALQADEQSRVAQEFHDSTGQHLAAANLALSRARADRGATDGTDQHHACLLEAVDDARESLREAQRELRVLSYLLHPPEIRGQGPGDAIASFASGFGRRAGLEVEVRVSPEAIAIDEATSLHLFRVCQEALTHVHRHAGATRVAVALDMDESEIRLTVTDDGVGYEAPKPESASARDGVFDGMRERMSLIGGSLQVSGGANGTILVATAPRA